MTSDTARQFGILAKYWRPGTVKTRLAASVGPELAAEFHRCSLELLLARFSATASRRVISIWPPDDRARLAAVLGDAWTLTEQIAGDLGAKMAAYFQAAFAAGAEQVVLIGSDNPLITTSDVEKAFDALQRHDVVLGPCDDGGYYLVGGRTPMAAIWQGIAWSTPHVYSQTISALKSANRTWYELPQGFDVDEIADVRRLLGALDRGPLDDPWQDALREVCRACLEHGHDS